MADLGSAVGSIILDTAETVKNAKDAETALSGISTIAAGVGTAVVGVGSVMAGALVAVSNAAFDLSADIAASSKQFQAELGVGADEAERLGQVAAKVWGDQFAGSIEEATAMVANVRRELGAMSDGELLAVTEGAAAIVDVFGGDMPQEVQNVKTLMQEFGLTSQQALDFIAKGYQQGLDSSGDFADTIAEYGPLFSDAGFSAEQMFSLLETGAAGGVNGVDKIADAVKEMQIKFNEADEAAMDALNTIGVNADEMTAAVAAGEAQWADYFPQIIDGLNGIDDPMAKAQLQTAIFGTMAEDLGESFTRGLSTATTSLDDMGGATDSLMVKYTNFGDFIEGFKRTFILALQPIGDKLLELANQALPLVEQGFQFLQDNILPVVEQIIGAFAEFFSQLLSGTDPLTALSDMFTTLLETFGLTSGQAAGVVDVLNMIITGVQTLIGWVGQIVGFMIQWWEVIAGVAAGLAAFSIISTIVGWVTGLVAVWGTLSAGFAAAGGVITFIVGLLGGPVTLVIAAVAAAIALLVAAWNGNWLNIQGVTQTVILFIQNLIQTALTAIQTFWATHGVTIMTAVQTAFTFIQTTIQTIITFVQNLIVTVLTAIQTFWATHGVTIIATVQNAFTFIQTTIQTIITFVQNLIITILTAIQTFWAAHGQQIMDIVRAAFEFIQALITAVLNVINSIITAVLNAILAFWNAHGAAIMAFVSAMFETIRSTIETLITAAKTIIDNILTTIKNLWDTHKSTVLSVVNNLWNTIKRVFTNTLNTIKSIFKAATAALKGDWTGFKSNLISAARSMWDSIKAIFRTAKSTLKTIVSTLITAIKNAFDIDWGSVGSAVINGIANAISSGAGKIASAAKNAAQAAFNAAKEFLGISSPSKKGGFIGAMFRTGWVNELKDTLPISKAIEGMVKAMNPKATAAFPASSTSDNRSSFAANFFGGQTFQKTAGRTFIKDIQDLRV